MACAIDESILLKIDQRVGHRFTDKVWDAFSAVLCDDSSVQSTYHSNHSLHTLQIASNWARMPQVPANIARVLKLNASNED